MRLRNVLIAVAVLAIAVPGMASAQRPAENGFKVTGGGQVIASRDTAGPGDTNAFNAHSLGGGEFGEGSTSDSSDGNQNIAARGQYQLIERDFEGTGNGRPTFKLHASVECLVSTGPNSARFGGFYTDDEGEEQAYAVDVQDNGQQGTDIVFFRTVEPDPSGPENDSPCEAEPDDDDPDPQLSRGNLQIHNNPQG